MYFAYLTLKFIIQLLPVKIGMKIGGFLGSLAFRTLRKDREKTLKNLRKVFADKKSEQELFEIGRKVFANAGLSIIEVMYVLKYGKKYLEKNVTFEGRENFQQAFAEGKGVIGLTAHYGNWEVMVAYLSLVENTKISVVAREMTNPDFDVFTEKVRNSFNVNVLKKGSFMKDIFRLLRNNEGIGILADQDSKGSGIFVDFLGFPAYTQTGIALISMKTKAVILPIFIRRDSLTKHTLSALKPLEVELTGDKEKDVAAITSACNDTISKQILKYPDQWMWMHNRWKTKQK